MNEITRHRFIKIVSNGLAAIGLAAISTPVLAFFFPKHLEETPANPLLVSNVNELPEYESTTVLYGRYPAIVVNTSQGFRGYSAVCTHFACIVKWNKEIGQFACPCHAGFYDPLDGHVISGPPPRPLTAVPVDIVDGEIYLGEKA